MIDSKPVEFRGSALQDLRAFPEAARREAGYQLDQVQRGREPDDWKPMNTVGRGVRGNSDSRCHGSIQGVVCGEIRRRRLCAALFPKEDAENKQSGSEPSRAALPGFAKVAGSMSKKRFANVWDAIEDTPALAENMKLRSALMMALKDHIARTGLSQSEAAKLLGVTQPRISDLMRGKIELFGLDTLVNMIGAAGLHVEMRISDAA
jgi:predicted XRE-type DNA-binding protein